MDCASALSSWERKEDADGDLPPHSNPRHVGATNANSSAIDKTIKIMTGKTQAFP